MSKELPILFNSEMVRAILEGKKTQTRRAVNVQPQFLNAQLSTIQESTGRRSDVGKCRWVRIEFHSVKERSEMFAPPCRPGDTLYVRETFRAYPHVDEGGYTQFDDVRTEYAADNPEPIYLMDGDGSQMWNKDGTEKFVSWRPSIHMPKEAARIWLEVESVRVERLQDISNVDAINEGVTSLGDKWIEAAFPDYFAEWKKWSDDPNYMDKKPPLGPSPSARFAALWQSVYGKESWAANSWVWVIQFKVLSTTGKPSES